MKVGRQPAGSVGIGVVALTLVSHELSFDESVQSLPRRALASDLVHASDVVVDGEAIERDRIELGARPALRDRWR